MTSAFSEFDDERHRERAEELLLFLGQFAVAFERVCESMRYAIVFIFGAQGLKRSRLAEVVIGDKSSVELQVLLGVSFSELRPQQGERDISAVHALLAEVKRLTEERNVVIHSAWQFGQNAAFADLYATSIRPRTRQTKGAVAEIHGLSAGYLRELRDKAKSIQARMNRLHYCLNQSGFKVAIELAKL